MVFVGVMSCNTDKVLRGEDAHSECHKPERWLSQLPETVTEAKIPGVYSNLSVLVSAVLIFTTETPARPSADVHTYRMKFWGGGRACM